MSKQLNGLNVFSKQGGDGGNPDSVVLEEEIDPNYVPSEAEGG